MSAICAPPKWASSAECVGGRRADIHSSDCKYRSCAHRRLLTFRCPIRAGHRWRPQRGIQPSSLDNPGATRWRRRLLCGHLWCSSAGWGAGRGPARPADGGRVPAGRAGPSRATIRSTPGARGPARPAGCRPEVGLPPADRPTDSAEEPNLFRRLRRCRGHRISIFGFSGRAAAEAIGFPTY